MIMVSLFVFLSLRIQNANHFTNAIYNYWWMFTLSLLCFIIAMSLALLKIPWNRNAYDDITTVFAFRLRVE